jgi:hypothetical protein
MSKPPPDIDALPPFALKPLTIGLLEENARLESENALLRDEIARLKGLKGRPELKPSKPSGMDKATDANGDKGRARKSGRRGAKRLPARQEYRVVKACDVPPGSRFKGYETFTVQDLVIEARAVHYLRERWRTADGRTVMAALPDGIAGHFGPQLKRFILTQYHQGQTTVPRLTALLEMLGLAISERQVVRILTNNKVAFIGEARDVLRAGLSGSGGGWISVDDTGARHGGRNGTCTQIGNHRFAFFATTTSKSRRNFLSLLRAGHKDYVLSDAAFDYMRERNLPDKVIALLAGHSRRRFEDEAAWNAHLEQLGITVMKVNPNPAAIAAEGALWGAVVAHGFLDGMVIVSDDAGQFNVGLHALCWVHAERLIHKLDTLYRGRPPGQGAHPGPIMVALCRPQGLQGGADAKTAARTGAALRSPVHHHNRVRHPGPIAGAIARQQGGAVARAGTPRHPAPYQRIGKRHPLPGHPAQAQRHHPLGSRTRLPRRLPRPDENMPKTRSPVLGLPGRPARRHLHHRAQTGRSRRRFMSPCARRFAGVTGTAINWLISCANKERY